MCIPLGTPKETDSLVNSLPLISNHVQSHIYICICQYPNCLSFCLSIIYYLSPSSSIYLSSSSLSIIYQYPSSVHHLIYHLSSPLPTDHGFMFSIPQTSTLPGGVNRSDPLVLRGHTRRPRLRPSEKSHFRLHRPPDQQD